MATRYFIGVGLGSVVTFLLFFLMQAVIATDEARLDEGPKESLDFVRLEEDKNCKRSSVPQATAAAGRAATGYAGPEFESSDIFKVWT